jgi:hypothetical protein
MGLVRRMMENELRQTQKLSELKWLDAVDKFPAGNMSSLGKHIDSHRNNVLQQCDYDTHMGRHLEASHCVQIALQPAFYVESFRSLPRT